MSAIKLYYCSYYHALELSVTYLCSMPGWKASQDIVSRQVKKDSREKLSDLWRIKIWIAAFLRYV